MITYALPVCDAPRTHGDSKLGRNPANIIARLAPDLFTVMFEDGAQVNLSRHDLHATMPQWEAIDAFPMPTPPRVAKVEVEPSFDLHIDTGGVAFGDEPGDEPAREIARILRAVADSIGGAWGILDSWETHLHDINGNTVGTVTVTAAGDDSARG